jgi:hypothetical protein
VGVGGDVDAASKETIDGGPEEEEEDEDGDDVDGHGIWWRLPNMSTRPIPLPPLLSNTAVHGRRSAHP